MSLVLNNLAQLVKHVFLYFCFFAPVVNSAANFIKALEVEYDDN